MKPAKLIPEHSKCQNCGICCGTIPATKEEIKKIHAYLQDKQELFEDINKLHVMFNQCPFRNNTEKKCIIYQVRPVICRLMGVVRKMQCVYGNSHELEININDYLPKKKDITLLNNIDWQRSQV